MRLAPGEIGHHFLSRGYCIISADRERPVEDPPSDARLGALLGNPHRFGGQRQRELAGVCCARRERPPHPLRDRYLQNLVDFSLPQEHYQ